MTGLRGKLHDGPCACGRPAELWLARTGHCRWCWRRETELEQLRQCSVCGATWVGFVAEDCSWCARREAHRDAVMRRAPKVDHGQPRAVRCPVHERGWHGLAGEIHGAHDPAFEGCNERAVPQ